MPRYVYYRLKRYRWKGVNQRGKVVSGDYLALNDNEVRDHLYQQSIRIKSLKKRPLSIATQLTQKVGKKDITIFTRQMSTMLTTGIPIIQALKLIGRNHRKAEMKSVLTYLIKQLESGSPLAKCFHTASPLFDSLYVDLVAAGEQSGNLADVFNRLADYREKSELLNAKVIKSLIYPAIVILTALAVTYLMLSVVIPEFEAMFSGFNAQLPWFTQQVLKLSGFVQGYSGVGLILLVFTFATVKLSITRSARAPLLLSRLALKIPIIGAIMAKASIARFCRTLAASFNAGVPILAGLKTSAKITQNKHYQNAIELVLLDTTSGIPLYVAMGNSKAFPDMVLQMVMIGEESGRLDEMLHRIADIYEFEIDNTIDNLGKILEPALILFLGVVVGGLVIAMYLPIFNLMSVLG